MKPKTEPSFIGDWWPERLSFSFFMLLLSLLSALPVLGQSLQEAQTLAHNGERIKAREMCKTILSKDFDADVAVLLARTYAWDGSYDSSRVVIQEVLKRYPTHYDALDAISDVEFWNENYKLAVGYCDTYLEKEPVNEYFLLKKAKILSAAGEYHQAGKALTTLLKSHPHNADAIRKLASIREDERGNRIRLAYTYDFFEKKSGKDPWHLMALSYTKKLPVGSVIGRINWAERFGKKGFQYETDLYPHLGENDYAYLNFGLSNASIFPGFRMGGEWYHSFPKAFEGSLGVRSLFFSGSTTWMYTATVGKYIGNYWISLRPFVIPGSTGTSVSGSIQVRKYFSDPEDYLGLKLGYGVSPDDRSRGDGSSSYYQLKSQSARVEYDHLFRRLWVATIGFSVANEQYPNGQGYMMNYSLDLGISRVF